MTAMVGLGVIVAVAGGALVLFPTMALRFANQLRYLAYDPANARFNRRCGVIVAAVGLILVIVGMVAG